MKKLYAAAVLSTLLLTACVSEAPPPSPSPVESLPPAQDVHVEFYEEFDRYNNGVDEHDFQVTEVVVNGEIQYCFYNREYDYPILVLSGSPSMNGIYDNATLELHGSQFSPVEFELPVLPLGGGNVDGAGDFYLEDLTGDDVPEFVYIYGWGGTGFWYDNVMIIDLSTMTHCSVSYDPVMQVNGRDVYTWHSFTFDLQEEGLVLNALFSEEASAPAEYIGSLSAPFVFDPDTSSFSPDTSQVTATEFDTNT